MLFVQVKSVNYSKKKKRFVNLPSNRKYGNLNFRAVLNVIKKMILGYKKRIPKKLLPEISPDMEEFKKPSSKLKFIWFGHSTLLLNINGLMVMIDPIFSKYAFSVDLFVKRFQPPVMSLSELPPIDYIVISHNHYDHLDRKTINFFKDTQTKYILPLALGRTLVKWGVDKSKITELDWHESHQESGIKFTATPSQHTSGRSLLDHGKTLWASWVILNEKTGEKIFFSGDTGYGDHLKEIGDKYGPFDIGFMENGQYNIKWQMVHMLPNETIQAFLDIKGKCFVPIHWGMFDLALHNWKTPVRKTYKLAKEHNILYVAPKMGEIINLENVVASEPWWEEVE